MKILTTLFAVFFLTGCASWYTNPEELAEMRARQLASPGLSEHCHQDPLDGFKLKCKDIPPEAKEGETCEKLAANMYYCH